MKAQITLTVAVAKEIIAEAIVQRADFRCAWQQGKILLKGGTTVSAVAHKMGLSELRISGRISPRGAKAAGDSIKQEAHSILVGKNTMRNIDEDFPEAVASLTGQDVAVIGANAFDVYGCAGILLGSPLGGKPGQGFSGLMAQGCKVIVACGLEKLIVGKISDACQAAGMNSSAWSMGMSCGLVPIFGEVVTEQKALEMLFPIKVIPIASGGICGAEGATTFILEGEKDAVRGAVELVICASKSNQLQLEECERGSTGCARHKNCAWCRAKGGMLLWYEK